MKKKFTLLTLITTSFFFQQNCFSQNIGEVTLKLKNIIRQLDTKTKDNSRYHSKVINIKSIFLSLNEKYQSTPAIFPSDYLISLQNDVAALKKVYEIYPLDTGISILDFVERDFYIKNITPHLANSSESVYKNITVIVKVIQNGKEVNGYTITANPEFWPNGSPMYRFNNPSSPTIAKMQPGEFIFYASLNGKIVKEKYDTVGTDKADFTHEIVIFLD